MSYTAYTLWTFKYYKLGRILAKKYTGKLYKVKCIRNNEVIGEVFKQHSSGCKI